MTIELTQKVFDSQSGEKTVILSDNANNACIQAGFSVTSGSVTVKGKINENDENHNLGFLNLLTGEIGSVASEGIYSLLGCEMLHSVTFSAETTSSVTAKFLY